MMSLYTLFSVLMETNNTTRKAAFHVPLHMPPQFVKPWVLHCVRPWKEMPLSTPLATHEFTPVKHNEFRHLENSALNVCIIIKLSTQKSHVILFYFLVNHIANNWRLIQGGTLILFQEHHQRPVPSLHTSAWCFTCPWNILKNPFL